MTALEIQTLAFGLRPHFWKPVKKILHQVDLSVERGEICGFLGPNGAGKTTTIKAILGLIRWHQGTVRVLEQSPHRVAVRRRLGYMPERAYFPEQLTATEVLRLHASLSGLRGKAAATRVTTVLDQVGLAPAAADRLRTFSKGMLQRIGMAQAIINDPDLVVLDEPMSGLDPLGRRHMRQIMLDLKAAGKTVFFSTHILPDVEQVADRVVIIEAGRTRTQGRLDELLGQSVARVEVVVSRLTDDGREAVRSLTCSSRQHGSDTVLVARNLEQANQLVDALRDRGVAICTLQPVRQTLEDLFMEPAPTPQETPEVPS